MQSNFIVLTNLPQLNCKNRHFNIQILVGMSLMRAYSLLFDCRSKVNLKFD